VQPRESQGAKTRVFGEHFGGGVPVIDFKTLLVLVSGPGAPRRFAKLHLLQYRRAGQRPLVPASNYLKLFRSLYKDGNLSALTDLQTLRQDLELCDLSESIVDTSIDFFRKYTVTKSDGSPAWDLLDCVAAATALDLQLPLAVINKAPYQQVPNLTDFEEWWRKP
jgi:hypothetical protein